MTKVTRRDLEVLEAIHRLTEPRGPTIRELCAELGMRSSCTAMRHVHILARNGLVSVQPGAKSRGTLLTAEGRAALQALAQGRVIEPETDQQKGTP